MPAEGNLGYLRGKYAACAYTVLISVHKTT